MRHFQLGTYSIGVMGLGCMGMSEFYGSVDEEKSIKVIHRALELGVNFFDTADMYGVGENERLVKKALVDSSKRDEAVIATKFGIVRTPGGGWNGIRGDVHYVRQSCEASLQRLGIDTIDLYYQHRVDPNVPIEETVSAMAELVQEGKVRHLGLSEATVEQIRRAHEVHPIIALQTEYSLWTRHVEEVILQTCRELGIVFVAYSPLGRGFLTGKYKSRDSFEDTDFRNINPRFSDDALAANIRLLEIIEAVAREKNCTPAQVALAWVHAQGDDIVSIPGTKQLKYLEENVASLDVELSLDDLNRLENIAAETAGARY